VDTIITQLHTAREVQRQTCAARRPVAIGQSRNSAAALLWTRGCR